MNAPQTLLFSVIVLCEPGPKWRRASKPIPRAQASAIVAKHWEQRRLVRLHPPRPVTVEEAEIVTFVAKPGSPFARQIAELEQSA